MASDFSEELKVSLIADATDIQKKTEESITKLKIFRDKANQQAQIQLRVTIAELETKIADARKRLSDFKKEGDRNGEIKTRLEISGLQQSKNQASKILRDLQVDVENLGGSFFNLNQLVVDGIKGFLTVQAAQKAIQIVGDNLKNAFDASVQFESAFAGVRKTVEASEEEFSKLSNDFLELSKQIPVSATELAKIGEAAGQLGVKQKDILEFTKTIAAIGVSTNLSQQEAATAFARIANIFQEPISKVSNLASSVVALGNNFATTESEIVNFTTRIAGAGKVAGLSTSDLAGISAAFTSVGVEAEAGGTAVSKTLQVITDAVNKGGKDLGNFASIAGTSAKDFTKLWRSDPAEAFNLFVQGLGRSGQAASQVLEELVGGDQRLKSAFLRVASAGDLLNRTLDTSKTAFEQNAALTTEANKRYETTESKLQKIGDRFNVIQIKIGDFLKAAAVPILDFFVTFAEALAGQDNALSGWAAALKAIFSPILLGIKIIEGLVGAIQPLIDGVNAAIKAFDKGGTSAKAFGTFLKLLFDAILVLVNPLIGISNIILQIVGSTEALDKATKNLKKTLSEKLETPTLDVIKNQFQSILDKSAETQKSLQELGRKQALGQGTFQASGQAPGVNVNQAFEAASAESKKNAEELRQSILGLLTAAGLTKQEMADFTSQLDVFNGATSLGTDSMNLLNQKLAEQSPILEKQAADFQATAEKAVASGKTWEEGIREASDKIRDIYKDNNEQAEKMVTVNEELFVANVAKTGDLGQAAAIAYGSAFSSDQARRAMETGAGQLTDIQLLKELAAAEQSGENGKAAGLLLALGIGDKKNLQEVATSGDKLSKAIQNAFNSAKASITASGKASGASLVAGIISGITERVPALGSLLDKIVKSLGGLASFSNVFTGVASAVIGQEKVAAAQKFFGLIGNKAADLQKQFNELKSSAKDAGVPPAFSGGGGGSKNGLDEAKKKADEAKKSLDDFTKSVADNNKAAEKLRNDTVAFYKDIVTSIDKAREKQAELNGEFTKFKNEQLNDFTKDAGKKDVELEEKQIELTQKLKEAQQELADVKKDAQSTDAETELSNALQSQIIAQEKYNQALLEGTTIQQQSAKLALDKANQAVEAAKSGSIKDLTENQQKQQEIEQKIVELQQEQNKILLERKQIQDFLGSLTRDVEAAQKTLNEAIKNGNAEDIKAAQIAFDKAQANQSYFDAYTQARQRATLTDFEQNRLELQDKISQKESEINAEKDKQQKIIDIQTRFLELQNAKTTDNLKKKGELVDLATNEQILTEQQKQEKLKELGFQDLTVEQQNDLLKQVQKANALEIEFKQVQDQQNLILTTKQKYQDLVQQYHDESVDKMMEKEKELISLIQQAQAEQVKLNSLQGVVGQASNTTSNVTNLNVTNNNNSNVDAEANNRNLLRKVK